MICVSDVLSTRLCPDHAHVRMVLASVFNRDINDSLVEEVDAGEAIAILASKMLLDMGYRSGYVQAIFRFLDRWLRQLDLIEGVAILSLADNRFATIISNHYTPVYDFTTGQEAEHTPAPLLQMSIDLTKLLVLVQEQATARENRSPAASP